MFTAGDVSLRTHHREMYFKRKQEERKKAKEEKRQAYVVWLSSTCTGKGNQFP